MGYFFSDDLYYPELAWDDENIYADPDAYYDALELAEEENDVLNYEAGLENLGYDCS